jgi:transposase
MIDHKPTRSRSRRSYTRAFKAQVVAETREPGVSVAEVARRHGMNANVVFHWLRDRRFKGSSKETTFLPVQVATAPRALSSASLEPQRLELVVELPGGARVICDERSLVVVLRAIRAAA